MLVYKRIFTYGIISFFLTVLLGRWIIPIIRKKEIGQNVRDDGPETHLSKSGTPTMGGIIIYIALIICLLISRSFNRDVFAIIFAITSFGLVGFVDDYFKIVNKRSLGLTAIQKLIGQFAFAIILLVYNLKVIGNSTEILVPFTKGYLDLGILYLPLMALVVVGTVNSVNLTDGLDGLASRVTMIVLMTFAIMAFKFNRPEVSMTAAILAGSCLGFLIYNVFPARIFMGDTGSMLLGGAVASIALVLNIALIIPIVGLIYFIEALSVIIQVGSFKIRKKRVFLMAPIHHHYEKKGLHENRIVTIFSNITLILALISIMSLF